MLTDTTTRTQVYRTYIRATPEPIWQALTRPESTDRYGYGGRADYDLRPGGAFCLRTTEVMRREGSARGLDVPDVAVDGEVLEVEPARRLVLTWRLTMSPEVEAQGFTRVSYDLADVGNGVTR